MKTRFASFLGVVALLTACGGGKKESEFRTLEVGLGTAAALGHATSIAMNALNATAGQSTCASVTTACTTFPCTGEVSIALGSGCPLPLGGVASGTVTVSASFSDADSAVMTTQFVDASAAGGNVMVTTATTLTMRRSGDIIDLTYVGQNVEVQGNTTLAAQSTWTIEIQTSGTPDDPSDDILTIDGIQQSVAGNDTSQLTVSSAVLDPACRLNPISGSAIIQEVGGLSVSQQFIEFHAACDGTAEGLLGGSIELNFLE